MVYVSAVVVVEDQMSGLTALYSMTNSVEDGKYFSQCPFFPLLIYEPQDSINFPHKSSEQR